MRELDLSGLDEVLRAWDLPSAGQRIEKRVTSNLDDMQALHDALVPRLPEIIEFLNQFPLGEIPEEYLPLKHAALSLLHVDRPVNRWKTAVLDEALDPRRLRIKLNFYDTASPDPSGG